MENKSKKRIIANLCVFLFIVTLLLGICIYSFQFYKELNIPEKGFLDIENLKKLGFWDESEGRYRGYWYPNGHLHPLYVFSTMMFRNCYILNIGFCVVILLYVILKSKFRRNISYNQGILGVTLLAFVINLFVFCFATYYYTSCDKVYPTDINFYIFLGNIIVYLTILIYYYVQKKNVNILK